MTETDMTKIPRPYRVMLVGAPLESFFSASNEEKSERFMPRFVAVLAEWEKRGARVVASFCDDVLTVAPPRSVDFVWYLIFEVDDLDIVAAMICDVRTEVDGVRLDRYVAFEARIGRPFWAREEAPAAG
jgi:hypothetical protein